MFYLYMYSVLYTYTGYKQKHVLYGDLQDFQGYFWLYTILGLHIVFRM
jgi:hypothetical protein